MANQQTPGVDGLFEIFAPMTQYVKEHSKPPEIVAADGSIVSASAPVSFAAALAPFVLSSGDKSLALRLQQTVNADISGSTGLLSTPARYYDQNLALFFDRVAATTVSVRSRRDIEAPMEKVARVLRRHSLLTAVAAFLLVGPRAVSAQSAAEKTLLARAQTLAAGGHLDIAAQTWQQVLLADPGNRATRAPASALPRPTCNWARALKPGCIWTACAPQAAAMRK